MMRLLERTYAQFLKAKKILWSLTGGRRERVFTHELLLHPHTEFPSFRRLRFPKGNILDTIVRYGDYVQMHALYLYITELTHRPMVVDVGAFHGAYVAVLGKLVQQKKGSIIAIEPNPHAFALLKENVRRNGLDDTVICENVAVMPRQQQYFISNGADQSTLTDRSDSTAIPVDGLPLSGILSKHRISMVDALIVDVEGAEVPVLQSIDWKRTTVARIFCELHPYYWKNFGITGERVTKFLQSHHYRCFDMYLREHTSFEHEEYIGPTIFINEKN